MFKCPVVNLFQDNSTNELFFIIILMIFKRLSSIYISAFTACSWPHTDLILMWTLLIERGMCKGIYQCTGRGIEKTTNDEHGYSAADLSRWKKLSKTLSCQKETWFINYII